MLFVYHKLSIYTNIHLSICNIDSFFTLSSCCHVRYCI